MKKGLMAIALSLSIMGCGESTRATGQESASSNESNQGMFKGNVGEKTYEIAVNCSYLDQDYFMFKSDATDVTDSNGDGIIISGMQTGDKFTFTVIDNGKTFSVGRLASFSKADNQAEGSGTVYEDGSTNSYEARFQVTCG